MGLLNICPKYFEASIYFGVSWYGLRGWINSEKYGMVSSLVIIMTT